MNMRWQAEPVLREALTLPEEERTEIAGVLLESLEPAVPEPGAEDAWRREVAARVAVLDAGGVQTTEWTEVRQRLLKRLGERLPG